MKFGTPRLTTVIVLKLGMCFFLQYAEMRPTAADEMSDNVDLH